MNPNPRVSSTAAAAAALAEPLVKTAPFIGPLSLFPPTGLRPLRAALRVECRRAEPRIPDALDGRGDGKGLRYHGRR